MAAGKRYDAQPQILLMDLQPNFTLLLLKRRHRLCWQTPKDIFDATAAFKAELNSCHMTNFRPRRCALHSQDSAQEYSQISNLQPA